ncbi:MAG: mltB [Alphaproteobacteria bacterium]|nr:mltB [Alphaproteobacteria bacterium]
MRFTIWAALAAVMLGFWVSPATAATHNFKTWLKELRTEAAQLGVSQETIARALPDTLAPIDRILELDRKQPEGTVTFDEYLKKAVNPDRIQKGRAKMAFYRKTLQRVEEAYGVDKQFIVALWGIETSYGTNTGGFDVVNALATLAYDGRRSDYFRGELFKALRILDEEHISHSKMKGSWAGAMGQSQFMPSSFLKFAVDFNKDGKRDIWTTEADVFASAANYLAESGWKKGAVWGRKVIIPHSLDRSLLGVNTTHTIQQWHDKGIRLADGKPVPFEGEYMASVVQPSGAGTTAFLVYENYRTLLKWNKSSYFASAVSTLAERLK